MKKINAARGGNMQKYGITEIARLLKISPQALRKYEKKGIIAAERNPDNSFRKYSTWEASTLLLARGYRQMGFSLDETAGLLHDADSKDYKKAIENRQAQLAREIVFRQRIIDHLDHRRREVQEHEDLVGRYIVQTRPAFRVQQIYDGLAFSKNADNRARASKWSEHLYLACLFLQYKREGLRVGLGIEEHLADAEPFCHLPYTSRVPACLCVTTAIVGTQRNPMDEKDFVGALRFLRENGYSRTGDVTAKVVYSAKIKGMYHSYHKVWFPIGEPMTEIKMLDKQLG
ncbi:MAG: MerR family transcriptional regulator [Clostridia bacterium]|nr:MerR family transcriptional regulator [Clostridia bacterium]